MLGGLTKRERHGKSQSQHGNLHGYFDPTGMIVLGGKEKGGSLSLPGLHLTWLND